MIRPEVIAHWGSSARYAENSWSALEAAAREGADAIECDVQATRDYVIVVRHDLAIDDRLLADLCLAEIEARALGIVVLADLLAFAESVPIDFLVEIKDPDAVEAVAQMIDASAQRDRCHLQQHTGGSETHRGWARDKGSRARDDPRIVAERYRVDDANGFGMVPMRPVKAAANEEATSWIAKH
jgi:glycerophosphoryl diester phosphodiesterase